MKIYLIASLFFLAHLAGAREAISQPVAELLRLMPEQTCHLVVVNQFSQVWETASRQPTSVSRDQGPDMATAANEFQDQFGLAPPQLAELARLAVVHAEISGPEGAAQGLLVARIDDQDLAVDLLARTRSDLERTGARALAVQIAGVTGTQYTWRTGARASRTIIHVAAHNLLISATDLSLATAVVQRAANSAGESNEGPPGAASIASHLAIPQPQDQPGLFWYSNPWCVAESGVSTDAKPDAWYERHGLKGIQALGGNIVYASDGALLAQTVVIAPPPRKGSLGILQLTPAATWSPPEWLCSDFDELVLLHGDVAKAFGFFGTIFDDRYADGIEGTYDAILEDLKDESGLNIDLKTQLFRHLGPSVLLVRYPSRDDASEAKGAMTYAIQTPRPEAVALAIRTLFADDPEAQPISIPGCEEPLWLIAGGGEGPDSGVIVTRGYMIFAEDAAPLRRALTTESGAESALDETIADLRQSLPAIERRHPSMFWTRNRGGRPVSPATNEASVDMARLFLSASPEWADIRNSSGADFVEVLAGFTPLFQHFSSGLGFNEEDGWSLFTK